MDKCKYRKKVKNTLNGRFLCKKQNKIKTDNACYRCRYFKPTAIGRFLRGR